MPTWCPAGIVKSLHSLALQANPFGSAKPVDTSSKLKEFEERIAKEKVGLCRQHHFHAAVHVMWA